MTRKTLVKNKKKRTEISVVEMVAEHLVKFKLIEQKRSSLFHVILPSSRCALQLPILEKHSGSRVGSSFRHEVSIIHPCGQSLFLTLSLKT